MADMVRDTPRLGWLDGLRGLAAMQVVLLHYVFAFLPGLGETYPLPLHDFWWRGLVTAPFVFLYDGTSAVYLFFIMSGVALTLAFSARPFTFLPTVSRRVIRLGVPMAAATVMAAALYALLPNAHAAAAAQTGSPWLRGIGPGEISVASIVHQIVFEGLLSDFAGWSLLPGWISSRLTLAHSEHGFNPVLWTLHLEFCGSLLVMLLVALRAAASQMAYRVICAILACSFVLSPLVLFIIGHVVVTHPRHTATMKGQSVFGAAILGSGILLCSIPVVTPLSALWYVLPPPPLGIQGDPTTLQKMIGAVLVFGGVALLPVLQRQLQRPRIQWFGKISFSLYLVHFPLAATCVSAGFTVLASTLPYGAAVTVTAVAGIAASLALAVLFERWIDRPAIMLSRMVGASRRHFVPHAAASETA